MNRYCLPDGYIERLENTFHDDTGWTDSDQREVYEIARELFDHHHLIDVLDLGCGSGYKLLKYFGDVSTFGVDLPQTVEWLEDHHRDRCWQEWSHGPKESDLIICADMIEHVVDPDSVLWFIERCRPKLVVMSTPDRSMLPEPGRTMGPPNNGCHVREWSMPEFRMYLENRGWKVLSHEITNVNQHTQMVVCDVKQ